MENVDKMVEINFRDQTLGFLKKILFFFQKKEKLAYVIENAYRIVIFVKTFFRQSWKSENIPVIPGCLDFYMSF